MNPEAHEPEPDPRVRRLLAPVANSRAPWSPARQQAVWGRIEAELAPRRRGARFLVGVLGGLAAAGAAVWLALPSASVPIPMPGSLTTEAELAGPRVERAVERLAGARMLPSGAHVEAAGAVVVLAATADRTHLQVEEGQVANRVPALRPGQAYRVETPEAVVEVRGTEFTVTRRAGATHVTVAAGRVEVAATGRPVRSLGPGEAWSVWPVSVVGAEAAELAGDAVQGLEIKALLALDGPGGLAHQNALLVLGRALDQAASSLAPAFWGRFAADAGPHAEEAAFRHVQALRRAGRLDEAREAAAAFRARFPTSPRVADTLGW